MIGIIDSGVGGLAIYRSIKKKLPDVGTIYFADKKNFPYGEKSEAELEEIARSAVTKLVNFGANVIIVACNSATVSTINGLREIFGVPIIGVEPAIKEAASKPGTGDIGLLATARTVKDHDSDSLAAGHKVKRCHNAKLIDAIENRYTSITDEELEKAIRPFTKRGIYDVVLGCTHYYFVKERLEKLFPQISFYAPDIAVVERLMAVMQEKNIELEYKNDLFLCSADPEGFRLSLRTLIGVENADIREV